jgi:hypothetical protein
MMRVAIYHLTKGPPLDLKTVYMRKIWSLSMALGTPEATNVDAVLSFSVTPPVLAIPNITFSSVCVESSIDW